MSSSFTVIRICQNCGIEFEAKTTLTMYCSHLCNQRHYKKRMRDKKISKSKSETREHKQKISENILFNDILTVKQAAALNSSTRTIYDMVSAGRLRASNLGVRMIRISNTEVKKLLEKPEYIVIPKPKKERPEETLAIHNCYSVSEIISRYGISRDSVYAKTKRAQVPKIYIKKEVYFSKKAIDKLYKYIKPVKQ